jgi:hypothetical protein
MTSSTRMGHVGFAAVLPLAVFFTAGCGLFAQPVTSPRATGLPSSPPPAALATSAAPTPVRHVGDFFVHRFSGSFAQAPLVLTEEVAAAEETAWVVDFTLTQNERAERLRVRFDVGSGRAVSASHFDGEKEQPAALAEYEALMARTVYAADVNDGLISEGAQTCLVGSDALDCETRTYKVWVGDAPATLSVVHAEPYADRDVSGEITTDDGKLVYRAELVEARQGKPSIGTASR